MKTHQMAAMLIHRARRMDTMNPICASGDYANASNKVASERWTNHMQPEIFGFTVHTAALYPPCHNGREPKAHTAWYHCCIHRF